MPKKKNKTSSESNPLVVKYPLKEIFLDITNLDLIVCLIIIFALFGSVLFRPWLIYDERMLHDGAYFPTLKSFGDFFEYFQSFGFNFNVVSSNTLYSSNTVIRTCPLAQIYGTVLSCLFGKNVVLYHLFSIFLHLLNTTLFYFILKLILNTNQSKYTTPVTFNRFLLILLTLIWACHPVMVEGVLLSTNSGALYSFAFFFAFLFDFLLNRHKNDSDLRRIIISILYLIPMFTNEYLVILPLIFFVISFHYSYQILPFKAALKRSIYECSPYFIGLFIYLIYFLFLSHYKTNQAFQGNWFIVFFERIFWLAPQIFFHFLKLIVFPKTLSIDQSLLVNLGKTLFDPYALFCIFIFLTWLLLPLILFLQKRRFENLFLLSFGFFFALLPYLHILMPSYTLVNERYLYLGLAIIIFAVAKMLRGVKKVVPIGLTIILVLCLVRSHYRTLDWKDNYTFISSTFKDTQDPYFKATRLGMLGKAISLLEPQKTSLRRNYFTATLTLLEEARENTKKLKQKFQKSFPLVLKAYGLDYDSLLGRIAFLEASSRCLDLSQDYKIGFKLLEPVINKSYIQDPRILELYIHFLIQDKNFKKAKSVLLKANKTYPHTPFILNALIDFYLNKEKNTDKAEEYIREALKYFPSDSTFLLTALKFYKEEDNKGETAKFAYLYGLRTQTKVTYQHALATFLNSEELRLAKRTIDKLLRLDPKDPETLYFASEYYYKTKDYKKALFYLTNAYALIKNVDINLSIAFDITHALAKLYVFLGDLEKANLLTNEIKSLAGNNFSYLVKLAKLYKSLGLNNEEQIIVNKLKSLREGA